MKPYAEFVGAKVSFDRTYGHPVDPADIHPLLLPHQRDIVAWAVQGGRRALFESFGLGKTLQQLEILRLTLRHRGGRGLIVCPLGVRQEFTRDAGKLGVSARFVRSAAELGDTGIYLTNYETVRDGKLDPALFTAVSLDEASVLRSFGSKTFQTFLPLFEKVPYRFVATATPSPNRYKELIHYAGFLGVMDTGQALTRFFQRDSTKANHLTLYPHKEREFWLWLNTWAVFLQRPSDLGYSDDGYDLPDLDVRWHEVAVDHSTAGADRDGQGLLFKGGPLSTVAAAREKRDTMPARIAKAAEIVAAEPGTHFILWHDLEDERRAIKAAVPEAVEVYGSQDLDEREQRVIDFADGKFRILATKPSLSGSGCNFQRHCHRAVFVGVGFSFNDFIQSVHRIQRYQQPHPVRIDVIYAESEREVVRTLQRKWAEHKELTATMSDVIREHGLRPASIAHALQRSIGVDRIEVAGDGWLAANNDCVPETEAMQDSSVDLIVTSIPFCYDETTEVLTRRGWLTFDQVTRDDEVATINPAGLYMEWQRPTGRVWERYDGEMLHFTGRSFDHLVTPNHRMLAARRSSGGFNPDQLHLVNASTIAAAYENVRRSVAGAERIGRGWRTCLVPPRRGDGKRPETVHIPPLPPHIRSGHGVQLYWVETEDFMRLAGWYLSEGHAASFERGRQGGQIAIAQCAYNQQFRDEIEALLLRIGLPPTLGRNQLMVWCRNLAWFLQQEFGHGAADKRIPLWVKELHPDLLEILRDTMMKGDGAKDLRSYASISRQLRDDFQEICLATGWRAATNGDDKVVQVGQTQLCPEIRRLPRRVAYSGMVGCLTVPNHTLIVRRNGKAFVSGNSNHYEYTPAAEDFGHTDDNGHFWAQMDYLTPQLLRVLAPGRIYCCHVKDRILFGNVTGAGVPTVSPFHAEAIFHGKKHGFDYCGMVTVVTDVVRENNQTYRLGWSEQCKDATKMGVGSPEYVLLFHKPQTDRSRGYADTPVTKSKADYTRARWQVDAHAFWRSSGDRLLTTDELAALPPEQLSRVFTEQTAREVYDYESHVRIGEQLDGRGALPATFMSLAPASWSPEVWHDVNRMLTLNTAQSQRRQQMHVCLARDSLVLTKGGYRPIQEVVPGELVLTHKGRWRPVLAVQNTGVREAISIHAQGVPGAVMTPDHKVWTRDPRAYARQADYLRRVEPGWVEASQTVGAYVNKKLAPTEHPSNGDWLLWWVVGRWLADGHIDKRGCAVLSCGDHEVRDLRQRLGRFVGKTFRATSDGAARQVQLHDPARALRNILKDCGAGAAAKHLPPEAYTLPADQAQALLEGYLSGDGHYRADVRRWSASSVSKELLLGVAYLVQRVHGTAASIYRGRPDRDGVILGRKVRMRQDWILTFYPHDARSRKRSPVLDDGAWLRVRSARPVGDVETWNLRVAEDESYHAEGMVVKNCPLQFDIVDRLIARFSNPGDLVFDPFGGLMTVPVRALKMGRRGRGVELNAGYFFDGVKYLQAEERARDMPSLFDVEELGA